MLIANDGRIHCSEHTQVITHGRFSAYWEGFVYGYGQLAGEASVRAFIQAVEKLGVCGARQGLSGSYSIAVYDHTTREWLAFSDPSRSLPWYWGSEMFSTSLLDLAKQMGLNVEDLNLEAVVEFLLTGLQFSKEILFEGIKVAGPDEIIRWRNGKLWIETDNRVMDPFRMPVPQDHVEAFLGAWERLATAIQNEVVSVDLTGGTDTRVIVGILDWLGVRFETAVSGTSRHSDVLISQQVAAILGNSHPHYPCIHRVNPERLWQELYEVVQAVDGVADGVSAHRLYQLWKDRASRGVTLVIGGSGGELYKDGGWWRAAALLGPGPDPQGRLIRRLVQSGLIGWGLEANPPNDIFHPALRPIVNSYKVRLIESLRRRYSKDLSEGIYRLADRLFFEYSVRAPRGFGARILPSYSPLLDVNFVCVGINLPWHQRFLHRFYRKVLWQVNPQLTQIPTNRGGMTLQPRRELIELLGGLQALKKRRQDSAIPKDDPLLFESLRRSPEIARAFDDLKAWKILADDVAVCQIPDRYLGRLITLWITLDLVRGSDGTGYQRN